MMELHDLIKRMSEENNHDLEIKEVIEIYLDYIRSNKREGTYRHDEHHLRLITDFMLENKAKYTADITKQLIYKYNRIQKEKNLSNRTINKRIKVLKRAIQKSVEIGFVSKNPLANVEMLKETEKEIEIIPTFVIENIFNYLEENSNNKFNVRDKAIIYLFLETGIRIGELVSLNYENINHEDKYIHLRLTKTNKERILYLTHFCYEQIMHYCNIFNINNGPLFRNVENKRITKNAIYCSLRNIKSDLNIEVSISPHKWRHTCATLCLENDASVEEVQAMLGHSNLTMTNRYVHVRNESVKNMIRSSSPLKKIVQKF